MRPAHLVVLLAGPALATSEVQNVTATSGHQAVVLRWTNPAIHTGVLVLRGLSAPSTAPQTGFSYSVGATLGNATVVYVDSGGSTVSSFSDTGLTDGVRYHYRVFNRDVLGGYAPGQVPTSSGISVRATAQGSTDERWCYATGLPVLTQPVSDPGTGVLMADNGGRVSSVSVSAVGASDGLERFRPLALTGTVQARLTTVPLEGRSGRFGLVGDQSGFVYAVDLSSGALAWTGNLGVALGSAIQAPVGVQLFAYADASFRSAHPSKDLVFAGTRNASHTLNSVSALSSVDGSVVWAYAPLDLDQVNGGFLVDYATDRLWVAARSNSGAQASLRVLSTLDGSEVARLTLGDLDTGVVKDFQSNQAYVIDTAGVATGIDLATRTTVWTANVGVSSSYLYPLGNGFLVSLQSGEVQRWSVSGATATMGWSTSVPGPSGVTVDYTNQVLYVGASDGTLRKLRLSDGVQTGSTTVSSSAVSMPTIDVVGGRLSVGTLGGELCSFPMPL
ncbi:MAG: PQQ-like beta-propeller repeat protein [Myxococcaceae bacterium]|nr:PQQ-like beta-propeller repeat protein [Myxococcaceae bacterium]